MSSAGSPRPRLLVILGPTGTGKSGLAARVAERLDGEIVGCDSLQLYRGLDLGTAKPTSDERRLVPHHLVDVRDPRLDYSVADYVEEAGRAIEEIAARGRVPLVVGGTGMYLRALLRGVVDAPPRDEGLRARLRVVAARRGPESLHRWLAHRDPETARRVASRDTQRIVRALELALSGRTWSERLGQEGTWDTTGERYPCVKIGLDLERDRHKEGLDLRVDRFFDDGLVDEVRDLLRQGVPESANSFKAIGYREVVAALPGGLDEAAVRERVKVHTRRYAKRQRSWFRGEPHVEWLDAAEGRDALVAQVLERWRRVSGTGHD